MLSPFESMEDQNPPAEFYIAARAYSRDFFSENMFLQFLSLSFPRERETKCQHFLLEQKRRIVHKLERNGKVGGGKKELGFRTNKYWVDN